MNGAKTMVVNHGLTKESGNMLAFLLFCCILPCENGYGSALELFMKSEEARPFVRESCADNVAFVKYLLMCKYEGANVAELPTADAIDVYNRLFRGKLSGNAAAGIAHLEQGMSGIFRVEFIADQKKEYASEGAYAYVRYWPEFAGRACYYYRYDAVFIHVNSNELEYIETLQTDEMLFLSAGCTTIIY